MFDQDKILSFVQMNGPVVPMQIAKAVGTNSIFASALLSELASNKKLKISHVKVGSSPLYYVPGQEVKLQSYSERLNSKEKKAYDLLLKKKLLRDKNQDPVIRVALREIKDFAIPLQVNIEGTREVFWKWYLLPDKEIEPRIRDVLQPKPIEKTVEQPKVEGCKIEAPKLKIEPPKAPEQIKQTEKTKPALPTKLNKIPISKKKPGEQNPEEFFAENA